MRFRGLPRRRSIAAALAFALTLGAGAVGCDVVQGFKHAGDALFPSVKTYLDAPGYRLAPGGDRDLLLPPPAELFVLARSSKDDAQTLYSIPYAVPAPCSIPKAGRYWAGGSVDIG